MAMEPPAYGSAGDGPSCIRTNCNNATCEYKCVFPYPSLSPPPPRVASSQSHMAPFLIATVCILGISFLLLTTCTIILRFRFTRRRRNSLFPGGNSGGSPIDDGDDPAVVDHPIWHITTVGLQQSVIDSITTFKYKKLDGLLTDGSDCSVCLSQFDDGDDLRLLPKCSHAFHVSCIDRWLRSHKNCPVCRAPVVNEELTAGGNSLAGITEGVEVSDDEEVRGEGSHGGGSGSGSGSSGRADDFGELPLEGSRIAEILKKNRDLRVLSDLAVDYRFGKVIVDEDTEGDAFPEPVRRSFSFNALAGSAFCGVVSSKGKSEGSSSSLNAGVVVVVDKKGIELQKPAKRGTSMSGLLTVKTSSFGRSLQKGPISMKISPSSSGKLFSFRRTKSQASILPL